MPTNHLHIKGKVQGVFFRATAKEVAEKIGITGWVKNADNGDVEIMATGNEQQLDQFIEWCKTGPSKAVVTNVYVTRLDEQSFEKFKIARG